MTMPPQSTKKHDAGRIPGAITIPNCIQVVLVWSPNFALGQFVYNVAHGFVASGFAATAPIAQAIYAALATAYTANLASFQPTTGGLQGVQLRDIRPPGNFAPVNSTGAATPGTSASMAMPEEVAAVLTARTAQAGRGYRGRMYIPCWATNANAAGGVIASGVITGLDNFATAYLAALTAQGITGCVAQPARNSYVGVTGTTHPQRPAGTPAITQLFVRNNAWDSQRRRGKP